MSRDYMINNTFSRRYNYNRNYFSKIDSPQKAYWVGFILGDGYITRLNKSLALMFHLQKKDKILLENFINEINGSKGQIKNNEENFISLQIGSKQMVQDLINIGIPFHNKTFTATVPNIPQEFISAFYLGLFDADGCVYTPIRSGKEYKSIYISLAGTKKVCIEFSKFLGYYGRKVYPIKSKETWLFERGCGISTALKIYTKLYEYDIPCLERKKNIFKGYLEGFF